MRGTAAGSARSGRSYTRSNAVFRLTAVTVPEKKSHSSAVLTADQFHPQLSLSPGRVVVDLARGHRAVGPDLVEHPRDELGLLGREPAHTAPGVDVRPGHPEPQRGMQVDPHQRRLVGPVLEHPAGRPSVRPVQHRLRYGPSRLNKGM